MQRSETSKTMNISAKINYALIAFASYSMVALATEPPLLDRQTLFFVSSVARVSDRKLSPDGTKIVFRKENASGVNLWIQGIGEPAEQARPLTESPRPVSEYQWSHDGKYVLYATEQGENGGMPLFAVDAQGSIAAGTIPTSRNLTPMDGAVTQIIQLSRKNPDLIFVMLNHRNPQWYDMYEVRISTGEMKMLYENKEEFIGYELDWDDRLRLVYQADENGSMKILHKDDDSFVPLLKTLPREKGTVLGWTPDNSRFYLETNHGDNDLSSVYLMDPKTRKMELFESDPEQRVDFGSLRLDPYTRQVISTSYQDDRNRYYWRDAAWKSNYAFLQNRFPGRETEFLSYSKDKSKFLVSVWGDRYETEIWYFDAVTRQLTLHFSPLSPLKAVEEHLAPMSPIRYRSSDGLEISGYLTLPLGRPAEKLPLVVLVHGGPKGVRDEWGYDAEVQFLANRGYAVLQPNFRASGGYGKRFQSAGNGEWGRLMQDDLTWGVKYLVDQGIADPDRVGIMGASYGGYAALAGLAFTPDLYACGIDIVGSSNLFTFLERLPPYFNRDDLYAMVGDPSTEDGKQRLREASPLFSADKITKPLLVIQGAKDPLSTQSEADQIVVALRDRGHEVGYLLADDEQHGYHHPFNFLAMYAEIERFLASKLGGRYQPDMPDPVAKRLKELRVDVSQVTYLDPNRIQISPALPPVVSMPMEGTEEWKITLEVQDKEQNIVPIQMIQSFPITLKRNFRRNGETWIIENDFTGPAGTRTPLGNYGSLASLSGSYTATLIPISESYNQTGDKIEIDYAKQKLALRSGASTTYLDYTGAMLCEGPGQHAIIAGFDWKAGDTLIVSMLDLVGSQIVPQRLNCEPGEAIDGKACLKVTLTNLADSVNKSTFWIDEKTRRLIRVEQVLSAYGNAKIVMNRKNP
jgi:dipeptidyl aminopeptidase/acylaminoacyl peptidase